MWGQLGDIALEPPIVPLSYSLGHEYGYAEMERISGKAGVQQVPDTLLKPTLEFHVHWLEVAEKSPQPLRDRPPNDRVTYVERRESPTTNSTASTVQEYLDLFLDMAQKKEAQPLTIGGQTVGNFVLSAVDVKHMLYSTEGELLEAKWQVKLLEFADDITPERSRLTGFLQRDRRTIQDVFA